MAYDRRIYPLALEDLFGPEGVVADENGDGYPDRLRVCIRVEREVSDSGVWAQILNLAARLAGEVTALDLPVVRASKQVSTSETALILHRPLKNYSCEAELWRSGRTVHLAGRSPARMADLLYSLAVHYAPSRSSSKRWASMRITEGKSSVMEACDRRGKTVGRFRLSPAGPASEKPGIERFDLLDLAETPNRTSAGNPRSKDLALTIELPRERLSLQVGLALGEVAVRAALEATRLSLPLAVCGPSRNCGVVLRVEEHVRRGAILTVEKGENASKVIVRADGDARNLASLLRVWMVIGFAADGPASVGVRRLRGRIERLLTMIEAGASPPARAASASVRRRLTWRSETERLIETVRRVPPGSGAVHGLALISKPRKVRTRVRREIAAILSAKGYVPAVVVLNAYKPGLSWLREVVQPALAAIPRLDSVRIAFREFRSAEPALEMRSRWLQELYPGPDLLATSLGLPLARVKFSRRRRLPDAYVVTAWDRIGARVYRAGFTPRVSRLPYLPGHPELGGVHPCTGGIRLVQAERELLDESFATDRERCWHFFQQDILPALEDAMTSRLADGGALPPAFWEEAAIDVRIEETDERLGIGEERIAPLEALHEDLYFVLLDHFRLFAEKHNLPAESQFGRIVPRVSAAAPGGRPEVVFRALPFTRLLKTGVSGRDPALRGFCECSHTVQYAALPKRPRALADGPTLGFQQPATECASAFPATAGVASIGLEAGQLVFEIKAGEPAAMQGPTAESVRAARSQGLDVSLDNRKGRFIFRTARPRRPVIPQHGSARKTRIPAPLMDRRLPLRELERQARRLGGLPHLRAWQAGTSWQGRGIWALEAVLAGGGEIVSLARARLLKPTLLLNARHHANEVSSTNAALRLAWELASTPWGRETLKRANAVIVPIENVDGVATLEELLPGCEGHKLHAARYNALGVEWYGDYFLERPRFPEARVKPLLWRRWLPLLVLDAHGVPSHEWDQPFSGYAPGRFRPFWIPRAFLYAIVPFIDQPSHPGHGPAREISSAMSRAVREERGIRELDLELKDRYGRYARAWDPDVFPAAGGRGLTILPSENRLAGLNFGVQRFPVTVSEIVTEVTDEVVSGCLLELCARAHLTVARALLEWLGRQKPGRLTHRRPAGGGLVLSWEAGSNKGRAEGKRTEG